MAAQEGNQFWKLRAKHGRDKLFETPELLWEAACEYFEYTDGRKWIKKDWVGKDAIEVERESSPPYTLTALCLYLDVNTAYFRQFKQLIAQKEDQSSKDFSTVITRIEDTIYSQKFEGAAVGAFNANIIARDLGLKDQTDVTTKDQSLNTKNVFHIGFDKKNDEGATEA